jgi:group I intron endonuclease
MSGKKTCIKSAIEKYDREQFVSVILLAGIEQQEELNLTEIVVIKHLDCRAPGNKGYNIHPGGRGGPMSNETRKKISESESGKTVSKETRAKLAASRRGRLHTHETKAAISASTKGRTVSKETRAKIAASLKGRLRTHETKMAISKAVVVTILVTGAEILIFCESVNDAATAMGVNRNTIGDLANKKREKSKGKGGEYANLFFTARFLD